MQQGGFHKVPQRYLFRDKESGQDGVLHHQQWGLPWRWRQRTRHTLSKP